MILLELWVVLMRLDQLGVLQSSLYASRLKKLHRDLDTKNLNLEEQRHLFSEFRTTVHEGEIVFAEGENPYSLTQEEVKQKLIVQRDELLKQLANSDGSKDLGDCPRSR